MKNLSWGWRVVIAFIIFVGGTMSWVTIAMTSRVDLVRNDYYENSLVHDAVMTSRAAGVASGASLAFDRAAKQIHISIPEQGAKGTLILYRPDDPSRDRTFELSLDKSGGMTIPTATLQRGLWRATLDWKNAAGKSCELMAKDTL